MLKPEGRGLTFAIVISIWAVLSTITIALRIWARYSIRAFGLDDWLMFVGWAIFMVVLSFDFLSISYGVGAHAARISEHEAQQAKKSKPPANTSRWFLFSDIGYALATAPIKASICVLLMRLTAGTGKRIYKWILSGVILLSCIGTITRVAAYTTRCKPFAAAWEQVDHGHCNPAAILTNVTWFFSGVCIFTDWVCAILPIFVIRQLSLPLRTKIQIACILALGMFASVATIIRMKHVIDYQKTREFLFGLVDVALWSETETFLGIVAGSLATMRPLLRYLPSSCTSRSPPVTHIRGTFSDPFRGGIPLRCPASRRTYNKGLSVEDVEYMGHSFQITTGTTPDVERGFGFGTGNASADGDVVEVASQQCVLGVTDTDIVKEMQYEVRIETADELDDDSIQESGRRILCGL